MNIFYCIIVISLPFTITMDDHHRTCRIFASGIQKRKYKVERKKEIEEVISQISKLIHY